MDLTRSSLNELRNSGNLLQSGYWGRFKSRYDWKALAFRFEATGGRGQLLVLYRRIDGNAGMAYVPNGPGLSLAADEHGPFLERLSKALRSELPRDCVFVRYDLKWKTPYADETDSDRIEDIRPEPRVRELRMNFARASGTCGRPRPTSSLRTPSSWISTGPTTRSSRA